MAGIHHFLFLSDPRTLRVIGEPKAQNQAVIALSEAVGMNVNSVSPRSSSRSCACPCL